MNQESIDEQYYSKSHAIFAEYAMGDDKMHSGINRRVFNKEEALSGNKIRLLKERANRFDGVIALKPGTYRINGFSTVTMQTGFSPIPVNEHFPGYCLLYKKEDEKEGRNKNICIGSWALSDGSYPSLFDCFFTCESPTKICLGHQAGDVDNKDEDVYYGINSEGTNPDTGDSRTSDQRLYARIAICEV